MSYLAAVLLGAVQGITEFLPISSSGHLAIVQQWLGLDPDSPSLLLFDVFAHLGTLLAVFYVFAASVLQYVARLRREWWGSYTGRRNAWRILGLAIAATLPTGIIGLVFQRFFEAKFAEPRWIGSCLVVTGVLLGALPAVPRGRRGWGRFRWWQAVLVGVAQAGAILPGISRSGATICAASYCGLRRRWAAEFSFLIAVPAILGGTALKARDTFALPAEAYSEIPWGPIVIGSVASLLIGVAALRLLLNAVRRAKLHYFAVYCWLVGIGVLSGVLWAG